MVLAWRHLQRLHRATSLLKTAVARWFRREENEHGLSTWWVPCIMSETPFLRGMSLRVKVECSTPVHGRHQPLGKLSAPTPVHGRHAHRICTSIRDALHHGHCRGLPTLVMKSRYGSVEGKFSEGQHLPRWTNRTAHDKTSLECTKSPRSSSNRSVDFFL